MPSLLMMGYCSRLTAKRSLLFGIFRCHGDFNASRVGVAWACSLSVKTTHLTSTSYYLLLEAFACSSVLGDCNAKVPVLVRLHESYPTCSALEDSHRVCCLALKRSSKNKMLRVGGLPLQKCINTSHV